MNEMRTIRICASSAAMLVAVLLTSACGTTRNASGTRPGSVAPEPIAAASAASRPASPAPVPPPDQAADAAQVRFDAALRAMRKGRQDDAQHAFAALAAEFPQWSGPATNLGILYAQDGRRDDAILAFVQATSANGANAIAWTWLGSLYRASGRSADAQRAYQRAIAAQPGYAAAHLDLAILYDADLRKPDLAAAEYRAYLKLDPQRAIVSVWLHELTPPAGATLVTAEAK